MAAGHTESSSYYQHGANFLNTTIRVCVLEGHQAELASAGLPLSVCLRLQELGLSVSAAQCSTRQILGILLLALINQWQASRSWEIGEGGAERGGEYLPCQKLMFHLVLSPAQCSHNACSVTTSPHQPPSSPPPLATTVFPAPSELPNTAAPLHYQEYVLVKTEAFFFPSVILLARHRASKGYTNS